VDSASRALEFALAHVIGQAGSDSRPLCFLGVIGLLGLFPGRTASLPGGLLRRQLRATEPWPDRFGILLRSFLERGFDAHAAFDDREKLRSSFEQPLGISSPGMLSTTENVCLGDASIGVARNPLRDGAPSTGHVC